MATYANWNAYTHYQIGDVVDYNGGTYNAIADSYNVVPPPNPGTWVLIPVGDISEVVAGTGLSGGGTFGDVQLDNAGVLSVDGLTGALTTKCGGWNKSGSQTISTTGSPSFVSITWNTSSYGDTTTISQNIPNGATFTINQHGIYSISLQVQYANLGSATLTDTSFRLSANVLRGGNTNAVITLTFDFPNNTPTNPIHQLNGVYELLAGDQITFQSIQYLSAGSFTINGPSGVPNNWDLNTYWNWLLVQPLP